MMNEITNACAEPTRESISTVMDKTTAMLLDADHRLSAISAKIIGDEPYEMESRPTSGLQEQTMLISDISRSILQTISELEDVL